MELKSWWTWAQNLKLPWEERGKDREGRGGGRERGEKEGVGRRGGGGGITHYELD